MAALLNDRNELLYSASSRVTGANVSISPGAATSIIFPKPLTDSTTITPVPAAVTLTASTSGYILPTFSWSYRFGDTGEFVPIVATTNPITISTNSAFAESAGTNTLVQYKVLVSESGGSMGVNQSTYTLSIPIIREGQNGVNGLNNVVVSLYKRSASNIPPTLTETDLAGTAVYTFATGQVIGQPAGWTQSIPSAALGPYLYVIQVQAVSLTGSYSFSNSLWSTAVLYVQDGTQGTHTAVVYAYKRSATAVTDNPGSFTYDFSTNSVSSGAFANSWQKTIPSGTDPLYVTLATAANITMTDSVNSTEWSTPVILVKDGKDGINSATIYLYARNNSTASAPAFPTTGYCTYNFSNGTLTDTIPSGWTQYIPTEALGAVLWVVQATAASTATTDTIQNTEWSTARILGQQGANGIRGSRQLYVSGTEYNSTYTYLVNAPGAASYAAKATSVVATATANTIPTTPIKGDTVTFSNGTTYVYTITYNSDTTSWEAPGTIIDGSLLVTGSVTAAKINTNGLDIRDANGNVILSAGQPLTAAHLDSAVTTDISTAKTNASTALSTANSASSTATSASNTANSASSTATSASNTANTALSTANSASSTANTASSTASSALTTAQGKLSKSGGDTLAGVISTNAVTVAGLKAGDLVWDTSGNRTSGKGVALTQNGIMGHNGSNVTFAVNATTGNATFAGTLSVASATSGARTEITNNVIKVYDSSGVLRVKLGDLSA